MGGEITLESKLGAGTKATFWIPFKKADDMSHGSPLVDLGGVPDRLRSDFSISISSDEPRSTHPGPPTARSKNATAQAPSTIPDRIEPTVPHSLDPDRTVALTDVQKKSIHVLVSFRNEMRR